jgi:hypothetical protein
LNPGDQLDLGQIVLALDYDPQFHAAAFHPHWDL